jgi:hypothetical protein
MKGRTRGISIVEMIVWLGLASVASFYLANFIRGSLRLTRSVDRLLVSGEAWKGLDAIQKDLRELKFSDFPFTTLAASAEGQPGWMARYDSKSGSAVGFVRYDFEPVSDGLVQLVRTYNPEKADVIGATRQVLVSRMLPPDASFPFFRRDAAINNVITVSLATRPPSYVTGPPVRSVRRVTLRS